MLIVLALPVLVNNVHTITRSEAISGNAIEDLDLELRSSVYACWHLMKLCFPHLRDKAAEGYIINFASEAGVMGPK